MPDPVVSSADAELRALVERALGAHYELDREIGRGGMGIVYCARDRRLKRSVAIKLLPPELAYRAEIRTRFLREAEMAAQLSHPHIVPIYSVDEVENLVFFVMAFVAGDNLAKRLYDTGRMGLADTRRVLREVADALAYAHGRHVIHRDIKPDNILLDAETGRAMVTDFGIARAVSEGADSRLTATGMAIGTPTYMSPEQAAGDREIDGRTDLYSLGVVGYQMLTGQPPFSAASTPALLVKQITERPVPVDQRRADVPSDLARVIMMLLEKEPAHRLPSAAALVVALDGNAQPLHAAAGGAAAAGAPSLAETTSAPPYTAPGGYAPVGYPAMSYVAPGGALAGERVPTAADIRRWEAEPVQRFRRKLTPYLFVNAVVLVFALFGHGGLFGVTMIWSVFVAYRYAKLWTDGYDWRDVFRQPRDRQLLDVAEETIDDIRAVFDRQRSRPRRPRLLSGPPAPGVALAAAPPSEPLAIAGTHAAKVRQAMLDRDEIARIIHAMPRAERDGVASVIGSAAAVYAKIEALAGSLAELDRRSADGSAGPAVEREIGQLEAAANPLDHVASEARVRRLAYLKRQRRALADVAARRTQAASALDDCALALQNMRFDVLRLRAGAQSSERVTSLAEQAMELARGVDAALAVPSDGARPIRASGLSGRG